MQRPLAEWLPADSTAVVAMLIRPLPALYSCLCLHIVAQHRQEVSMQHVDMQTEVFSKG